MYCASLSSYGSLMPRSGFFFIRYSAASAMWIGPSKACTRPLLLLPSGSVCLLEHHVPAGRRLVLEDVGVVHQHVPAPLVRHAVVGVVLVVPGRLLQPRVDRSCSSGSGATLIGCTFLPRISRVLASPDAVTRSKPPSFISATISSEVPAVLTLTLQPRLLLEVGHPVEVLVGGAALDVAGPGDDVDLALRPCRASAAAAGRGPGCRWPAAPVNTAALFRSFMRRSIVFEGCGRNLVLTRAAHAQIQYVVPDRYLEKRYGVST